MNILTFFQWELQKSEENLNVMFLFVDRPMMSILSFGNVRKLGLSQYVYLTLIHDVDRIQRLVAKP